MPGQSSHKNLNELEEQKSERRAPTQVMHHRQMGSDVVIGSFRKKEPMRYHEKLLSDFTQIKNGSTPEPGVNSNTNLAKEPKKRVLLRDKSYVYTGEETLQPCSILCLQI